MGCTYSRPESADIDHLAAKQQSDIQLLQQHAVSKDVNNGRGIASIPASSRLLAGSDVPCADYIKTQLNEKPVVVNPATVVVMSYGSLSSSLDGAPDAESQPLSQVSRPLIKDESAWTTSNSSPQPLHHPCSVTGSAPGAANAVRKCPFAALFQQDEVHAGEHVKVNRCPFNHGSVGTGPFPGYVHGAHPAICSNGCMPDPCLGKHGRTDETPSQTLIREALEFQDMYHSDQGSDEEVKAARVAQVLAEIETTGTYTHTADELQHGARLAWRAAETPAEMFKVRASGAVFTGLLVADMRMIVQYVTDRVCLQLLENATAKRVTTANIAVFRAQTPGSTDGPRAWNTQLNRFAGYQLEHPVHGGSGPDKSILGDPAEADFTSMLMADFGWQSPGGKPGRFDVLPLVLQAHPDQAPQLFEVPSQYVTRVSINHPTNDAISSLGLQWYAVPAVSAMELSVGGLTYTACPFNGWYADTEIVRNLTDESRYNMCPEVAACLGLDTRSNASMWKDRAIVEMTVAVMHSFRKAGMGMVDHHTLMNNFFTWYHKESRLRGFCPPGNWKWIITPVSSTASRCYLELNKMTEYTLKPGYWIAPNWRKLHLACQEKQLLKRGPPAGQSTLHQLHRPTVNSSSIDHSVNGSVLGLHVPEAAAGHATDPAEACHPKPRVVIAYATVSGTTEEYARAVAKALQASNMLEGPWGRGRTGTRGMVGWGMDLEVLGQLEVQQLNCEDVEGDAWPAALGPAAAVLLMSSTYGPGAPPASAAKFITWLNRINSKVTGTQSTFIGKPFAVLGFGSRAYPRFCAAADLLHSTMLAVAAEPLLPVAKADAVAGEEAVVWPWLKQLVQQTVKRGWLDEAAAATVEAQLPGSAATGASAALYPQYNLITLKGEGLQAAPEPNSCQLATVMEAKELLTIPDTRSFEEVQNSSSKSTKLIRLKLGNQGNFTQYSVGDHIAVWAEIGEEQVEEFAALLGLSAEQLDDFFILAPKDKASEAVTAAAACNGSTAESQRFPLPATFRSILARHVGLAERLSFAALTALAACAPEDEELQMLAASYQDFSSWAAIVRPYWQDLFNHFPSLSGRVPLSTFFALVPVAKPRYYSIASSPAATSGEVDLCVGRVSYFTTRSRRRRTGFCSTWLTDLAEGQVVRYKIISQPSFRPPLNLSDPVLLVAAGTGMAPFKGFWEDRQFHSQHEGQQLGTCLLLFGCRSSDTDFLFKQELAQAVSSGTLTKVLPAFSREPGVPKTYVQDVIMAAAAPQARTADIVELRKVLLHPRCHVFVCGGSVMAADVCSAVTSVVGQEAYESMLADGRQV
eukprot:gene10070-10225_t